MFEPTKINKKVILVYPLFIANFLPKLYQTSLYPLEKSSQINNSIIINITKIDWSFIKAQNINYSFKDTQTDAQMHNNTYSVAPLHSTIIQNWNSVPPPIQS